MYNYIDFLYRTSLKAIKNYESGPVTSTTSAKVLINVAKRCKLNLKRRIKSEAKAVLSFSYGICKLGCQFGLSHPFEVRFLATSCTNSDLEFYVWYNLFLLSILSSYCLAVAPPWYEKHNKYSENNCIISSIDVWSCKLLTQCVHKTIKGVGALFWDILIVFLFITCLLDIDN